MSISKKESYNKMINKAADFYNKGNSSKETSLFLKKKYGFRICSEWLRRILKKHGIKIRTAKEAIILRKRKHINIPKLIKDFKRERFIRKLSKNTGINRLTIKKIIIENNVKYIPKDFASHLNNTKYKKIPFSGNLKEKAYIYGFVVGDVSIIKKSSFTLKAVTNTTHKTFVILFRKLFNKYGKVTIRYNFIKKEWCVQSYLDYKSFKFLNERKKPYLPSWINPNNFFSFLAGFIDADGSIIIRKVRKNFQFVIKMFGQNKNLLNQIKRKLEDKGFSISFHRTFMAGKTIKWKERVMRYNKDYYTYEVYRRLDVIRLLKLLPIKHEEKVRKKCLVIYIHNKGLTKWEDVKEKIERLRNQIVRKVEKRPN